MEKKFRIFSIVLILECFLIYGFRFGYYYMKSNKKGSGEAKVLFAEKLIKNTVTEGDGLYKNGSEYVYRGVDVNNYLYYSNILFRIVKINSDNSITLITDSKITNLPYGSNTNNYVFDYLNYSEKNTGIFESKLNNVETFLSKTKICKDKISNINNITCKSKDETKYVSLLNLADFKNSKIEDTYLNNVDSFWLNNESSDSSAYFIANGNISTDLKTNLHGIRPVITLNNKTDIVSGDGTLKNPYRLQKETNSVEFNSYIKLGNDLYTVYEMDDNIIRLVNTSLVKDTKSRSLNDYVTEFNPKLWNSVAYYLNNGYLNSLSYKNSLVDCTYYTGSIDKTYDYKKVYDKKVVAKVGLLSITDVNLNNDLNNYFLLNIVDNKMSYVNNTDTINHYINNIRPTVCIKKDTKFKGNGTRVSPFELEV